MANCYHIIIADDDEDDRLFIQRSVMEQYPTAFVSLFSDGDEAFEHYRSCGADVVITDFHMLRMDGAELTRALRSCAPVLTIIVVSDNPDSREESLSAGADGFLEKGEMEHLAKILHALLS